MTCRRYEAAAAAAQERLKVTPSHPALRIAAASFIYKYMTSGYRWSRREKQVIMPSLIPFFFNTLLFQWAPRRILIVALTKRWRACMRCARQPFAFRTPLPLHLRAASDVNTQTDTTSTSSSSSTAQGDSERLRSASHDASQGFELLQVMAARDATLCCLV